MEVFANYGLPEELVSDNGPQFCSDLFTNFLNKNGIKHLRSAPFHPATNGEAERFLQTFKTSMKRRRATPHNVETEISKFLMSYRTTEHRITGNTPSYLFYGRNIRNKLDLLIPEEKEKNTVEKKVAQPEDNKRSFKANDLVWARSYNSKEKWVAAKVEERLGKIHYKVNIEGKPTKRHIDQLICRSIGENSTKKHSPVPKNEIGRTYPKRNNRGVAAPKLNL